MKILVTGSHGFIGSQLVPYLEKEHTVCRYTDIDSIPRDVDVIIHLAGRAHDTSRKLDQEVFDRDNFGLTARLYDRFLNSGMRQFIFFSSIKAEDNGIYGRSKRKAEEYILARLPGEGRRVHILRPCLVYGSNAKGNLALLKRLVDITTIWPLGAFENKKSLLSMPNLLEITGRLVGADIPSGIYPLADDETVSTTEIVSDIALSQGKSVKSLKIPKIVIKSLARPGGILRLPFNMRTLAKLTDTEIVDNSEIKRALSIDKLPSKIKRNNFGQNL